jgi:predicted GTPase
MRRVVIMGAGGRDFHVFSTVFRDDPTVRVVAFTATQIPGIDDRTYPASLAGPQYPEGIPIVAEERLVDLIGAEQVDEVVFAYSDVAHVDVMHAASIAMAAGADFRLAGPAATMLRSTKPVVGIGAVRTGCGKSQTTRAVGRLLLDAGLRVALIRHPMPYGDLEAMRVQRFGSLADIDASDPTVEEREEYEAPVEMGMVMFAGVDYEGILRAAEAEADVIVWDGGNNDFPFVRPDLMITVVDPLRPGHESTYHPGETTLRLADVVVVNKVDTADPADVERVVAAVGRMVPDAIVIRAESPVTLEGEGSLAGQRVLVIEDGPTLTHGGMPFGAGTVAARAAGATEIVDPRPWAVRSIADTYAKYPDTGTVLPAMGYGDAQLADLAETIRSAPVDVVVSGTPMDLGRIIDVGHPMRRASYVLREVGSPTLAEVLAPHIERWRATGG